MTILYISLYRYFVQCKTMVILLILSIGIIFHDEFVAEYSPHGVVYLPLLCGATTHAEHSTKDVHFAVSKDKLKIFNFCNKQMEQYELPVS